MPTLHDRTGQTRSFGDAFDSDQIADIERDRRRVHEEKSEGPFSRIAKNYTTQEKSAATLLRDDPMSLMVTSDRAFGPPARPDVRCTSNSDQTAKCREGPGTDLCSAANAMLITAVVVKNQSGLLSGRSEGLRRSSSQRDFVAMPKACRRALR